MTTRNSKPRRKKAFEVRALSDVEVARYLRQLVAVHKDKRTGNPLLAMALKKLAERLEKEDASIQDAAAEKQLPLSFEDMQQFDAEAISRFTADTTKTKSALIELAASRFSIPRGKLLRMKLDEVREAVNAALQHENSLNIIGEEAERQGSFRKS